MSLVAKRLVRSTWREAVAGRVRNARPDALDECLSRFDGIMASGGHEAEAAYRALEAAGALWSLDAPSFPAVPTDRADRHSVPDV